MQPTGNPCRKRQEEYLEIYLAGPEQQKMGQELANHLKICPACRQYWEGLKAVHSLFPRESMYTTFLRTRTLARLREKERMLGTEWLPAIFCAALVSMIISFALPVWLLSKLFLYWGSSMTVAYTAAWGGSLMAGMFSTIVCAVSFIERGMIRLNGYSQGR